MKNVIFKDGAVSTKSICVREQKQDTLVHVKNSIEQFQYRIAGGELDSALFIRLCLNDTISVLNSFRVVGAFFWPPRQQ